MLALGDALAMVLLEARGFQKEDFAKFHPGGMIGRSLLLRVHQIMRPRSALALVTPDANIRAVLKTMTECAPAPPWSRVMMNNCSAFSPTAISSGISNPTPRVGERLVADLMTLNPVTVHQDKLAVEVLNLLERHRIDDLVVVDDHGVAGRDRRFAGSDEAQVALRAWTCASLPLRSELPVEARATSRRPLGALTDSAKALNSQLTTLNSSWPPQTISAKEWQ